MLLWLQCTIVLLRETIDVYGLVTLQFLKYLN
jgi:hypothetical protein